MKKFIIHTKNSKSVVEAGTILAALTKYQLDNPFDMVVSIRDTTFDDIP